MKDHASSRISWPAFVLAYTYAAAYLVALFVFQVARALGV